jgi:hypothetical protein
MRLTTHAGAELLPPAPRPLSRALRASGGCNGDALPRLRTDGCAGAAIAPPRSIASTIAQLGPTHAEGLEFVHYQRHERNAFLSARAPRVCFDGASRSSAHPWITVVTSHDGLSASFAWLLRCARVEYALAHGVRYCELRGNFDVSRAASWNKLVGLDLVARHAIPGNATACDPVQYVWWMDADVVVTNASISLEQIAGPFLGRHFIWQYEVAYPRGLFQAESQRRHSIVLIII